MRKSSRTIKRRLLLLILHASRIPAPISYLNLYTEHHWLTKPTHHPILNSNATTLLNIKTYMTSMHNSIYSENTTLWLAPLATKGTRRSTYRRINSTGGHPAETRRIRHNTNFNNLRPHLRTYSLPIHNIITMRYSNNQLNLSTPNRSKITNRLLIR